MKCDRVPCLVYKNKMQLRYLLVRGVWMVFTVVFFIGNCYAMPSEWTPQSSGKAWSIQSVTDNVRAGERAIRFEVRKGEERVSPRSGHVSYRSELSGKHFFRAKMDKDYWYGFSMYMSENVPDQNNRLVIGQWHGIHDKEAGESKRSPVLAQRYRNGKFYVTIRYSSKKIQTSNDGTKKAIFKTKDFKKGVWHDFVYHVRWSYRNDGFVEMWWNGKKVINYKGPVGYNDDEGPFFKYGIYRNDVPETYVVYFDEYRRGNSYGEVDPSRGIPVD